MTIKFRGQGYPMQCPVCDGALTWPAFRGPAERIDAVAGQHLDGCPASIVDPARLRRLTPDGALAEAARLRTASAAARQTAETPMAEKRPESGDV